MTTPAISPTLDSSATVARSGRYLSIDLLRGLTIGFMIIVNDNGSSAAYWPLKHAAWNGFTPTDLVFPTFLFLVGLSLVLSTASRIHKGETRKTLLLHLCRRSLILFLLGLAVNSFPFFHLATMRFYGVLPRIAICYFVVGTFYLLESGWRSKVWALLGALVGYWLLMRYVPVPGYGVPGRDVALLDRDGNLAAWLDRQIFAANHLYERTRDPEGLLSTLPALGTTLIGLLTGLWLRSARPLAQKARGILAAGVTGVLLGALWNLSFPINKKLWTSSYVLFAGGLSLMLLALFIWLADLRGKDRTSRTGSPLDVPLLVFGTNAIAAYVLSELLASALGAIRVQGNLTLSHWLFLGIHAVVPDEAFASLLFSLGYTFVCWLVVYVFLYRRRIFIKI
jgi:predicted acyltransferase